MYFNSRPSARGDATSACDQPCKALFQFTPLREGRRALCQNRYVLPGHISIHAPPRGATPFRRWGFLVLRISIHAPPRGATGSWKALSCPPSSAFQFTPLREGRRGVISPLSSCVLFQFTPLREGRRAGGAGGGALEEHFNSRPSARGDDAGAAEPCFLDISIHAPPRGATGCNAADNCRCVFQFTPLREGRPTAELIDEVLEKFQFTPLREGRPQDGAFSVHHAIFQFTPLREGRLQHRLATSLARLYFNSRPSARGDHAGRRILCAPRDISIHAPPRGATIERDVSDDGKIISIHAPPRGATWAMLREDWDARHFNSRPSARGDGKRYAISANLLFNPYKSAWLNNSATQFVEIILVIFHRIIA